MLEAIPDTSDGPMAHLSLVVSHFLSRALSHIGAIRLLGDDSRGDFVVQREIITRAVIEDCVNLASIAGANSEEERTRRATRFLAFEARLTANVAIKLLGRTESQREALRGSIPRESLSESDLNAAVRKQKGLYTDYRNRNPDALLPEWDDLHTKEWDGRRLEDRASAVDAEATARGEGWPDGGLYAAVAFMYPYLSRQAHGNALSLFQVRRVDQAKSSGEPAQDLLVALQFGVNEALLAAGAIKNADLVNEARERGRELVQFAGQSGKFAVRRTTGL
jgi:hypothetical protein